MAYRQLRDVKQILIASFSGVINYTILNIYQLPGFLILRRYIIKGNNCC